MTQPTIIIKKLNLMGYTPETQVWFLQNGGGGQKTFDYMKALRRDRDTELYQFMGASYIGVRGDALARQFALEAANRGFDVKWEKAA